MEYSKPKSYSLTWKIFLGIWLFLFIYNPKFIFLPIGWLRPLFFSLLPVFLLKRKKILEHLKKFHIVSLFACSILVSALLSSFSVLNGSYDFSLSLFFFPSPILFGVMTLSWVLVFSEKVEKGFDSILAILGQVGTAQALFMLLEAFFQPIRDFFHLILIRDQGLNIDYETTFRVSGLSNYAGDGLGFIQAVLGFCVGYLIWRQPKLFGGKIQLFLILFSMFFCARTGIFLIFFFLFGILLFFPKRKLFLKSLLQFLGFFVLLLGIIWFGFITEKNKIVAQKTLIPWLGEVFEDIYNLSFLDRSSALGAQYGMLFLPTVESEVLFGNGYFVDLSGKNAISSDNGYVRTIFAVGSFGLLGIFFYFFIFVIVWVKFAKEKFVARFCFLFWFLHFFAHNKVPYLYFGQTFQIIWLLTWGLIKKK